MDKVVVATELKGVRTIIKDGENGSMLFRGLDEDLALFSVGNTIPTICSVYDTIAKPTKCPPGKNCLCICDYTGSRGYQIYCGRGTDIQICKEYSNELQLYGNNPNCNNRLIFVLGGDNPNTLVYYERKGNYIGICTHEKCLPNNVGELDAKFNSFYQLFTDCLNIKDKDCSCPIFNNKESKLQLIKLNYDGSKTTINLYDSQNSLRIQRIIDSAEIITYNPKDNKTREWLNFEIGKNIDSKYDDYNYDNTILFYKTGLGKTTIVYNKDGIGARFLEGKRVCGSKTPANNEITIS